MFLKCFITDLISSRQNQSNVFKMKKWNCIKLSIFPPKLSQPEKKYFVELSSEANPTNLFY